MRIPILYRFSLTCGLLKSKHQAIAPIAVWLFFCLCLVVSFKLAAEDKNIVNQKYGPLHQDLSDRISTIDDYSKRRIGIDFYQFVQPGNPPKLSSEKIKEAVEMANRAFADPFITFYVNSEKHFQAQHLHLLNSERIETWKNIKQDAKLLGIEAHRFKDSDTASINIWVNRIGSLMAPERVPVFITYSGSGSNCNSPSPHNDTWSDARISSGSGVPLDLSRAIKCLPNTRGIRALPHELGHYVGGLIHTFDVANASVLKTALQEFADYYDLIYKKKGNLEIEVFTSRDQAVLAKGPFFAKDNNCKRKNPNVIDDPIITCVIEGKTYENGDSEIDGLIIDNHINGMSYLHCPQDKSCGKNEPMRFSKSQKELLYKNIELPRGQRHMLGSNGFSVGVTSSGKYRLDVFWKDRLRGRLMHQWYSAVSGWSAPQIRTEGLYSDPAVVSWSEGRLDVFWRNVDNKLKHMWRSSNGVWSHIEDLGSNLRSSPAVASRGQGRLDVFWKGDDNRLKHKWFPHNGGWSREVDLGGHLNSDPAVASWGNNRLDVFWKGVDSRLKHRWYPHNGKWSHEEDMGQVLASAPTVTSWGEKRLDVFWKGMDGKLKHIWYPHNAGWSHLESFDINVYSNPSVTSWGSGRLDVFWKTYENELEHVWYSDGSGWSQVERM